MDALVLLDLLGAADPHIQSYYPSTGWMFDELKAVEARLGVNGILGQLGDDLWQYTGSSKKLSDWNQSRSWFAKRVKGQFGWGGISDGEFKQLFEEWGKAKERSRLEESERREKKRRV